MHTRCPCGNFQPQDLVLTILLDVARGMQYLHSMNVLHGDMVGGGPGAGVVRVVQGCSGVLSLGSGFRVSGF